VPNKGIGALFGSDYECVVQSNKDEDERRSARECCHEVGGELSDGMFSPIFTAADALAVQGRCIFKDAMENPRDDWRSCAMKQSGATFADCYHREKREVDDELRVGISKRHQRHGKHRGHGHRHSHSLPQHSTGNRALLQHVLMDVADMVGESDERFVCQVEGTGEEEHAHRCCVMNGGKEGQDGSTSRPTVSDERLSLQH
jgi:hypothetical protein